MKPALAEDAVLDKLIFPCWAQPKIDGVRALNLEGTLTGRSLDPFKGFGITEYFSKPEFIGLDGEMVLGFDPASQERLCSLTSSAMGKFKGMTEMPNLSWWVFDYVEFPRDMYKDRYARLQGRVDQLKHPRIRLVPYDVIHSREQAMGIIDHHLNSGYEGTIWRNPNAVYKEGRTDKHQQLWRSKPWQEDEMLCTGITEGDRNENEAKTNSLGRTERSSAQAGKVPNGQVGSLQGTLLKDVFSNVSGKLLFPKGLLVTIGSGEMSVAEATDYFQHPEKIVNHTVKFKHLAHGTKDKPRMGTFRSLRLPQDLS